MTTHRARRALAFALGLLSLPAAATPARTAGLSNNPGFFDPIDFLVFPSELDGQGANIWMSYGGTMDAGFSWEGDRSNALWATRVEPTTQGPWKLSYTSAREPSGYQLRTAWEPGDFSLGGSWGKGFATDGGALAVGGDLHLLGDLEGDADFAVNAFVSRRKIQEKKLSAWGITAAYVEDTIGLGGALTLGPRWEIADQITASAGIGPELGLAVSDGDMAVVASVPSVQLGVEYNLRPWFFLRGSAQARWMASYVSDDLSWSAMAGGMVGVGMRHTWADFDLAINPAFAMNGPYLFTGSPTSPFAAVASARFFL